MNENAEKLAPSGARWRTTPLSSFPPPDRWDDWEEYDSASWPKKVARRYRLIPTICFNCEAGCGLMAFVDKDTGTIRKLEGNPYHPGSRGRNCAKGPATLSQVANADRILYPLRRSGPRGSGSFVRTTWKEVVETLAARIRKAIVEGRLTEVMYHVGRPGHDGAMEPVLRAFGLDGHNSHTNICSAGARLGYALWAGADRPSPDYANAGFILLLSAHLESGHYFNPHAQRIMEAKAAGAKIATIDIRLSNTAAKSDYWLAPRPGTEAALLLGFARTILEEDLFDRRFLERWVNWREFLSDRFPKRPQTVDEFIAVLKAEYARFTPEWVGEECDVSPELVGEIGREIGNAKGRFASHIWRNAASGNLGGWQVARCLMFLNVLTGSVGTKGGTGLAAHSKFVPPRPATPPPQKVWNELLYPPEWPLAHHEMSFLLPYFLSTGRGRVDTYFTRVYNPVWTNPDGFSWIEALKDEEKVGFHAALTPVWSETALYADYVLPMGLSPERHDLMSQETHAGSWIGFRQPVLRVAKERAGEQVTWTWEANPGEVWEEDEFWIALGWAVDRDGSLGIRRWFESPYREGERITAEEQYRWIFENGVPGLPEAAQAEGLTPLQYMRRYGSFLVTGDRYDVHETPASKKGAKKDAKTGVYRAGGKALAVAVDGKALTGFPTPSRKLEIYSKTMVEWGMEDMALPGYLESHVHRRRLDSEKRELVLVPTFRVPTLIHTRSANAKWLVELSNSNPVWMNPEDARLEGVASGDLIRVTTPIGYFVNRAWVTESIRPGVVACSHHLGRWRLPQVGTDRWAAAPVSIERTKTGAIRVRRLSDVGPFESSDPDSRRIFWTDGGVHQNLAFPVQPDPVSGMNCWHQRVTVRKAAPSDRYGDVVVDPEKARKSYEEWLALARGPADPPGGLRRPLWMARAVRPADSAYERP